MLERKLRFIGRNSDKYGVSRLLRCDYESLCQNNASHKWMQHILPKIWQTLPDYTAPLHCLMMVLNSGSGAGSTQPREYN
jgi:hypothetical protein